MFEADRNFTDFIQQPHALDVLRALHRISHPQWRIVKEFALKELGVTSLSDLCYRERCKDLVSLHLCKAEKRPKGVGWNYRLTESGHEIAALLEETLRRIERWRTRASKI